MMQTLHMHKNMLHDIKKAPFRILERCFFIKRHQIDDANLYYIDDANLYYILEISSSKYCNVEN